MSYEGLAGPAGELELIPDLRMSGWAPSLKVTYTYSGESSLYFSLARALRMPTAPEHYWHYDPDDAGVNTSGLPFHNEDGVMLQAGWRAYLPTNTQIEISPYFYRIRDYIQFDLINFVSYNIDNAELFGIEMEVIQQWGRGWSSFMNYSYERSRTQMRVRTQSGYARLDLELRYPVFSYLEANAFVRNLLDADYQERFGFPVAGRTVGLSLKTGF